MFWRGHFRWLLLSVLTPALCQGQIIDTIVGNAINDNRAALQTPLVEPEGLAFDNAGNLIIADRGQFVIRRISGGNATVIAGGGDQFDDSIPIPPQSAALDYPAFVAVGSDASIYFSDYNDYRVRRITPAGRVTNVAGSGYYGYYGDGGKATLADLSRPAGLALDRTRNLLYIADTENYVIRRVNLATGIIDTVAGNGFQGYTGDGGAATFAELNEPWGLAVDSAGNLYITDSDPATYLGIIRKVSLNGTISTLVSSSANMHSPKALAFDPAGNLYVALYWDHLVARVDPGGSLTVVAGGGLQSSLPEENVPATSVSVVNPTGIAFDAAGNLYISEEGWDIVRRVDQQSGMMSTYAGTLDVLDNGPALNAPLSTPRGIAIGPEGSVYISDTFHNRIRRIDVNDTIQTVVGTGEAATSDTAVDHPGSISVDAAENLYFAEPGQSTVSWREASSGRLYFLAGLPDQFGYSGDGGYSTDAELNSPKAIVSDAVGNVYIADTGNHCIRKVDLNFIITRVAGVCTESGYSGDGGPALQARLHSPGGLALDADGNLLISDSGNSVVRRVNLSTGIITLVAGIPGEFDYSGDGGPPSEAALGWPAGLAVEPSNGTVYIADSFWSVIRVIRGNRIYTLAGVGLDGFYGDGYRAQFAYLNSPEALAVDPAGNLLLVDTANNRVRKITLAGLAPPALSVTPASLTFRAQAGGASPPSQFLQITNSGAGFLDWDFDLDNFVVFDGEGWLWAYGLQGIAPSYSEIYVDPSAITAGTYHGQIVINSPGSSNTPATIPVTLVVDPPVKPAVVLSTGAMHFEAVQGGSPPSSRVLSITNSGSGTLNWLAGSTTFRGGEWLTLSKGSGSTQAGGDAGTIVVSANPAGLSPGFYLGLITVTNTDDGNDSYAVVGMSVGSSGGTILITSSSFVFYAIQGGIYVPPQLTRILNTGQGIMHWLVNSSVAQGNWLRVSPSSGFSDASNPAGAPAVTVSVDPTGLSPGVYGGYLSIESEGARNSPQLANVILKILPPGSPPIAQVQPAGLVFTATTNSAPQSRQATVQTTGGGTLTYGVGVRTQNSAGWLTASPTGGSLTSSTDRTQIRVQVAPGSMPAGVYRGAVNVSFSDGTTSEVAVVMILHEPGAAPQSFGGKSQGCASTQQVLLSTGLANNFSLPTGWPKTVIAVVDDNCGNPLDTSTVTASFNTGDATLILDNQGGGVYSKDWVPSTATAGSGGAQVTLRALHPDYPQASLQLVGTVSEDSTQPVVTSNGIVNGASFTPNKPVSPGGIVSIFGENLATAGPCFGGNCATDLPLPSTLGGVTVKIGGLEAALFYAGPGQINAQVPSELTGVTSADVVVTSRGVVSAPRSILLDDTQPGIFQFGGTRGAVLISNSDYLAAASGSVPGRNARPAHRGTDYITIYCTGLGAVNDPPPSGSPATGNPLSRTTVPVTVTIGGVTVSNVSFSGLSPGFVGLYQVDVQVPSNVSPGSAVPLKITQNGVDSNEVTIAID